MATINLVMKNVRLLASVVVLLTTTIDSSAQEKLVSFQISVDSSNHSFHVRMDVPDLDNDTVFIKMPAWTPGYYQLLNFADNVSGIKAYSASVKSLAVIKSGRNGWKTPAPKEGKMTFEYDVKTLRPFVATPYADEHRAYISPPGVFMYVDGHIALPASVALDLFEGWESTTGLESSGEQGRYLASNFDILFDSPILLGPLEELEPFSVDGVPHFFVGYNLGDFDREGFMRDLKKVVEQAVAVIGDIPYKHYTFIAIGPGRGGIEHLNSTTFGFSGSSLSTPEGKKRMYSFLAHEYFHHYNVKRIRPIELGPFDYDRENCTNMLWVAEGITVYYDLLVTRRAGLMSDEDLLEGYRSRMLGYENKPGRLFQSATQASYNTWSDGPFGRANEEFNKTISVYDKGAVLGVLLDFAIRHHTNNAKSLDDAMRKLYNDFYLGKKRGYTEGEFRQVCETVAGADLGEVFEYASTTKEIDYKKYFGYAGLDVDNEPRPVPGGWLGISTRSMNDSLKVTDVEYQSPAWNAGVRRGMTILSQNKSAKPVLPDQKSGDSWEARVYSKGGVKTIKVELATKTEASFKIAKKEKPTSLEGRIFESWVGER